MERNRVSLSNYFGRIFDDSAPVDMTQSVNLQEGTNIEPANIFSSVSPEPTASAVSSASELPDPATFFDTITPDMVISPVPVLPKSSADFISQSMKELSVKDQQVSSDLERRRDAWIPTEETKKVLIKAQSVPAGSFFPEREALTTPGIIMEEELTAEVLTAARGLIGVGEAASLVRPAQVTRDDAGLRDALRTRNLHSALSLTTTLISALGQGAISLGRQSRHTPRSLQLWLTRFAVMVRLRMRDALVKEAEAFGDLSKPDMFYQFYPETHGGRMGSMAPFSLRLLLAEVPLHAGEPRKALDAVYVLLSTVRKILSNLNEGLTEDGSASLDERERAESLRLWQGREARVMHSLVNCAVALKDYRLAIGTTRRMAAAASSDAQSRALYSALCRLSVQAGHVRGAEEYFATATQIRQRICPTPDVREYVDRALLAAAQGKYQEACAHLAHAAEQDPTDVTVANNTAVCLLYSGRLKEAIAVLQRAISADPERALSESLILNLCTLYELESSRTRDKKLGLLRTVCKYKAYELPDIECLKLA